MSTVARITSDKKLELYDEVIEYPSELEGGRNLIISSDVTPGTYVGSKGSLPSIAGHFITGFIEVKANEFYTISMLLQRNGYSRIAYYDMDKYFIKRDLFQNQETTQITPEQDGFIRWSPDLNTTSNDYIPGYKIEKGTKSTDWTPAPEDLGYDFPPEITSFKPGISSGGILLTPEIIEDDIFRLKKDSFTVTELREGVVLDG